MHTATHTNEYRALARRSLRLTAAELATLATGFAAILAHLATVSL